MRGVRFEWLTLLNRCGNGSRISAKRSVVGYWMAGNRRVRGRPAPASISRVQESAVNYHATRSDRQQSLEAGFEHHVVKPVDPQILQEFMAAPAKQLSTRERKKAETRGCKVP